MAVMAVLAVAAQMVLPLVLVVLQLLVKETMAEQVQQVLTLGVAEAEVLGLLAAQQLELAPLELAVMD
jgi:hypothetical protein